MKNLNTFKLLSDYESEKSGGVLNTPNVSFITEDNSVRYLLEYDPYNGHEYVDLGLPSGLKWATCNVGASKPEDTGLYFAWGETVGYTDAQVNAGERVFDEDTYNAGPAASISTNLMFTQDAARVNMGGNWRMPTLTEHEELINNTDQAWISDYNGTGVNGYVITSKSNGNSIFLPAAGNCYGSSVRYVDERGFYWSSTWRSLGGVGHGLYFYSDSIYADGGGRYFGRSVRGVCE